MSDYTYSYRYILLTQEQAEGLTYSHPIDQTNQIKCSTHADWSSLTVTRQRYHIRADSPLGLELILRYPNLFEVITYEIPVRHVA